MKPIAFMRGRFIAATISGLLLTGTLVSLGLQQLNWGLDFIGGTLIELNYERSADLGAIRDALATEGYDGALVVSFGSDRDVLVRLPISYSDAEGTRMVDVLRASTSQEVTLQRMEFVGPQVGDELREQGGLAMLLALGLVLIYVGFRFQLKFAMGAVIALAHDVLIILGFFSITRLEFDLSVLAAILAVIGYSLNDTIVVSDRIRENLRKIRKMSPLGVIDVSLNETLGRTLVTSLTTMLVLTSLAILGGDMIFGFAVALLVGVSVGTYSSIYVASTSLLALGVTKEDVAIPVKEGEDQDAIAP